MSAVGHEIDFTISDFVADLRAATPSAAAEIITEGAHASRLAVVEARRSMNRACGNQFNALQERFQAIRQRLARCRPTRLLRDRMQYLDEVRDRITRLVRAHVRFLHDQRAVVQGRFLRIRPMDHLQYWKSTWADLIVELQRNRNLRLRELRSRLKAFSDRLRLLSPAETLARGYSITTNGAGTVIRTTRQARVGETIRTRVADGVIESSVTMNSMAPLVASRPDIE